MIPVRHKKKLIHFPLCPESVFRNPLPANQNGLQCPQFFSYMLLFLLTDGLTFQFRAPFLKLWQKFCHIHIEKSCKVCASYKQCLFFLVGSK